MIAGQKNFEHSSNRWNILRIYLIITEKQTPKYLTLSHFGLSNNIFRFFQDPETFLFIDKKQWVESDFFLDISCWKPNTLDCPRLKTPSSLGQWDNRRGFWKEMTSNFSNYLRYEKVRYYLDVLLFAQRNLAKEVKETVGISLKETKFLLQVSENPGASLTKIQNLQHMPTSSAAWVADRLVAKGLLNRRQNPDNRREVILDLTDGGANLLKRLEQIFFTVDVEKRLSSVDEKIVRNIENGLRTLCELYGVEIK